MCRQDGFLFWARLETDAARDVENGSTVCRTTLGDITESKRAGMALINASKELEKRVEERTVELLTATRLMKRMLDERKRAEERITGSRERLRNLSGRPQPLLEDERTRISREIHDEPGQSLAAMKLDLSSIKRSLVPGGFVELSGKVHAIELAANRITWSMRKIAAEPRPGILDELGVVAAIEWMAKEFQNRTGINCHVEIRGMEKKTGAALDSATFRIVQEALTNVLRHAAASRVSVALKRKGDVLTIEVKDNGVGITEARIFGSNSFGLIGMRERVLLLGGEAVISGKPGEGTLVRVTLPVGEGANSNA